MRHDDSHGTSAEEASPTPEELRYSDHEAHDDSAAQTDSAAHTGSTGHVKWAVSDTRMRSLSKETVPELTVAHVADTLVASAQTVTQRRFRVLLLIRDAYDRLTRDAPALKAVMEDLSTMLRLLYAWANASYQRIPWPSLMMIAGAVGYFVLPFDLVPDLLGPVGLMDDAAIIASTVQTLRDELDRFRAWESAAA